VKRKWAGSDRSGDRFQRLMSLVDVNLPGIGLEIARVIKRCDPRIRIVVLSASGRRRTAQCDRAGAAAYSTAQEVRPDDLMDIIHVASGTARSMTPRCRMLPHGVGSVSELAFN